MLGAIAIMVSLIVMTITVVGLNISDENKRNKVYKKGYNDCLLDMDEIIADWKDKDIHSVGIETLRNRIALEWME